MSGADLLIIGGGPAGCAAAITARQSGLNVILIERQSFPRHRPGESLHPGIQPLFRQLGIEDKILAEAPLRYKGQWTEQGDNTTFQAFGEDDNGSWQGFQIPREQLDLCLIEQARLLGVDIRQPCRALEIVRDSGKVTGLSTTQGEILAQCIIDASGGRHWLAKQLNTGLTYLSRPLYARYGYVSINQASDCIEQPRFKVLTNEWQWLAQISERTIHWTRLFFDENTFIEDAKPTAPSDANKHTRAQRKINAPPTELAHLPGLGGIKGADVSWRKTKVPAEPGYYIVGDAAFVLDPTSSHGVLKALMSGIYAANLVAQVYKQKISDSVAAEIYNNWLTQWLEGDVNKLKAFYQNTLDLQSSD
ncbi:NAD(P)/FAD-dependent oxidoreductase [Pseudoalteromonas sp. PPB1]|uniref:NAD(P)/FAD-dependent oxidoreductase n=1 Tax=Pseudoalteromonas sp. PPB1 TaxID=2756136 RepID=UPI001890BDD9|nr:FAD-dependent oxidoreductase [Pseudoalteromonas sp. PPB1]